MNMTRSSGRAAAVTSALLVTAATAVLATGSPAGAARPLAKATLYAVDGTKVGEVSFKGPGTYADRVEVRLVAPAIPNPGSFHGLHVHTTGACDPGGAVPFASAGSHWNPTGAGHGHHAGDLPSVLLDAGGRAYAEFETDRLDVASLLAGDGSAVILHALPDNFAHIPVDPYGGPRGATAGTGDAGPRYACGVVRPAG